MSEVSRGARVSGNSRGRSTVFNERPWRPGRSAGQISVLMLRSKEQDTIQEILVRQYPSGKEPIVRGGISEYSLIGINNPVNLRSVSFFLTERGTGTTPVVQDIDPKREPQFCAGISYQERETGYILNSTAAGNSCSVINKSGDLSCAEE
jgi:hypothetical protein